MDRLSTLQIQYRELISELTLLISGGFADIEGRSVEMLGLSLSALKTRAAGKQEYGRSNTP